MAFYYKDRLITTSDGKLIQWNGGFVRNGRKQFSSYAYPTDQLWAIWRLNGNLNDEFSTHNLSGSATSYVSGSIPSSYSQAALFNANAGYLTDDVFKGSAFSISLWFYCTDTIANATGTLISNAANVYLGAGFVLAHEPTSNLGIRYGVNHSGVGGLSKFATWTPNQWNHFVFTYSSGNFAGFMNNIAKDTGTYTTKLIDLTSCYFGASPNGANLDAETKLASIFWYNKVLSTDEISNLYAAGAGV